MSRLTPQDVIAYVNGRNSLVHAAYLYQCRKCLNLEHIFLGVGVEGPDRGPNGAWIASPFMGPPCLKCGGDTSHIAWQLDLHFPEPIQPPYGVRYFAVPVGGPRRAEFNSSCFAGEIRNAQLAPWAPVK